MTPARPLTGYVAAGRRRPPRNDLALYDRLADQWWDPRSRFAGTLHGINELRMRQILDEVGENLRGLSVVDLGCGGGLLSEPLARRGATVVGVDLSRESLAAARLHGAGIPGLSYRRGDVRDPPVEPGSADLVLCADVLEHVEGWRDALAAAARLLRPGGRCYCSTLNRTLRARWLAVHAAEGLGMIPAGTHDPARFIRPAELAAAARDRGFADVRVVGQRLRLWATLRAWRIRVAPGRATALAYSAWLTRGAAP